MRVFTKFYNVIFKYFLSKSKKSAEVQAPKMSAIIMDEVDLEREYNPAMWSDRFPTSKEVFDSHLNFVTIESEIATYNIPHKLEIEYGSTPGQKLDILGIDLPNDAPILVFIHGGFWQELSREVSRYPAQSLHRSRIKTIVVGFDLCPAATLAEIINQIQNAAKFVFEYAEKNGSRGVYFAGHGAGAHLIAKLFASAEFLDNTPGSNRLQGAFLISGLYDLRELIHTSYNKLLQLPYEWTTPLSPQFDCFTHLQARKVRIYILAAQKDSPTFKKQSREFYELLHNTCLMQNMYLEIKDNMDHYEIVECFTKDGNYMRNLLLHDIRFWQPILREVNENDTQKYLQTEGLNIHQCAQKMSALQTLLEKNLAELVDGALQYAKSLYEELGISFEPRQIRRKHNFGDGSVDVGLSYENEKVLVVLVSSC